ncbi:class I SAM-dependent methyltransferase [bacterium]|nr:class I SAM-dependent methyltransferase [bacterium]
MSSTVASPHWWRWPWLDELRRRVSYLIYVQHPWDVVPVVPQSQLLPPIADHHVEVLLRALEQCLKSRVDDVAEALVHSVDRDFVAMWPGEHYRLLAGFSGALKPRLCVEVGTWQGAAAAILSRDAKQVVTFDIVSVDRIPGSIPDLLERYPNVAQVVGDLMQEEIWVENRELFANADLVFVDGPKDGMFEPAVVPRILDEMKPGSLMILDDIRFAGMHSLWKDGINYPRIDLGSFGHFSGTGIVFI